jgi:hypothetical protein
MYFKYAGKIAIAAWYQLQSNPAETCLTYNELFKLRPHLVKSPYDDE